MNNTKYYLYTFNNNNPWPIIPIVGTVGLVALLGLIVYSLSKKRVRK